MNIDCPYTSVEYIIELDLQFVIITYLISNACVYVYGGLGGVSISPLPQLCLRDT